MYTITANRRFLGGKALTLVCLVVAGALFVQSTASAQQPAPDETVEVLDAQSLTDLVARMALYPDDLVAIMLPASTYPLQVVEAARFLEARENDASLTPDEAWDDAIVALLNYPEALALLNDDLDWTWQLGEAVLAQQEDVLEAIERFRDDAFLAGNLESDEYQTVAREEERIVIRPADPEVIYVPYYDPVTVIVRQPYRSFHYYGHGYPVYYYPYAYNHRFYRSPFWGVSTAFSIHWRQRYLHLSYFDSAHHPYFGWNYDRRRFLRHRRSVDYRVYNGGTGRYDRRGAHYRWYPSRFHGTRPNYHRTRSANRQTLRYSRNRDGYTTRNTRRATDRRQRYRRSDAATSNNRRAQRGSGDRQRRASGTRRDDARFANNRRTNNTARSNRTNNGAGNTRRRNTDDARGQRGRFSAGNQSRQQADRGRNSNREARRSNRATPRAGRDANAAASRTRTQNRRTARQNGASQNQQRNRFAQSRQQRDATTRQQRQPERRAQRSDQRESRAATQRTDRPSHRDDRRASQRRSHREDRSASRQSRARTSEGRRSQRRSRGD